MDKAGNFIGWLFVDGVNVSVSLVENGLARMHFSAENSQYYKQLEIAESNARKAKLGLWASYVEEIKVSKPLPNSHCPTLSGSKGRGSLAIRPDGTCRAPCLGVYITCLGR